MVELTRGDLVRIRGWGRTKLFRVARLAERHIDVYGPCLSDGTKPLTGNPAYRSVAPSDVLCKVRLPNVCKPIPTRRRGRA